jgi:hypothetical protein
MTDYISKRAVVNGVNLHYIVAGAGPVALGMHGWPQNHRARNRPRRRFEIRREVVHAQELR